MRRKYYENIWASATLPADCNDETDGRKRDVWTTLKGGSVIRIEDEYVQLLLLN
jgi:hypothetical protein